MTSWTTLQVRMRWKRSLISTVTWTRRNWKKGRLWSWSLTNSCERTRDINRGLSAWRTRRIWTTTSKTKRTIYTMTTISRTTSSASMPSTPPLTTPNYSRCVASSEQKSRSYLVSLINTSIHNHRLFLLSKYKAYPI